MCKLWWIVVVPFRGSSENAKYPITTGILRVTKGSTPQPANAGYQGPFGGYFHSVEIRKSCSKDEAACIKANEALASSQSLVHLAPRERTSPKRAACHAPTSPSA